LSYYYRGNLAMEVEQKQSTYKTTKTKRTLKTKPSIPAVEKLLYLFVILVLVLGVGFVGTRYVQISQYNHEIQKAKMEIAKAQETNASLQLKIDEMSSRARIEAVAAEMGMQQQTGAVHVVGSEKPIKKTEAKKSN